MPRGKKDEDHTPERLLELIDEQAKVRGAAVIAELDATARIAELASEARRKGATMADLRLRVQRMDKKERKLTPVTRQALDTMLAVHEERREPRTTRASRRRRDVEPEHRGPGVPDEQGRGPAAAPAGTLDLGALG
jgi:hypothetical protein